VTKYQPRREERATKPTCQATVYAGSWYGLGPGDQCPLEATHGKRCWVHSQRSAEDDVAVERKTRRAAES